MCTTPFSTMPIPAVWRWAWTRRQILVHRRSGLGDGHVLRHHLALVNRVTMLIDEAEFDLERWYETVQDEKVEVWYSAPTAIRMMMREGAEVAKGYDFSSLGFLASVGEPLNPEAVVWSEKVFGQPFHDNWWQTETGGIMIANRPGMEVKPGLHGASPARHRGGHRREDGRRAEGGRNRRDRGACAAPRLAVDDADLPP
jgi:acyl-coenzyme A synthetase/AMP-(fatty) acid ligase